MLMTFTMPVRKSSNSIPDFRGLKQLRERLRQFSGSSRVPTDYSDESYASSDRGACDSTLNELIVDLDSALQSVQLGPTLSELSRLDGVLDDRLDAPTVEQQHERARLVNRISVSLGILSGSFRTAAEELQEMVAQFSEDDEEHERSANMIEGLCLIAMSWQDFADSIIGLDGMMLTGPGVASVIEQQRIYLARLEDAMHSALEETSE